MVDLEVDLGNFRIRRPLFRLLYCYVPMEFL